MKKKVFIIHPFLFAMFPVVFLYNRGLRYVLFTDIILPAVLILFLTLLALGASYLIYRNMKKSAILVSVFMLLFFSYGHIHDLLCPYIKPVMIRNSLLMGLWFAILFVCAWLLFKTKRGLVNLSKLCNVVAVVLIAVPLMNIVFSVGELTRKIDVTKGDIKGLEMNKTSAAAESREQLPDIYYLIFDRYNDAESLRKYFNYDNSPFLDFLSSKGFYVASKSTANYPNTTMSLASSLNMQYLNSMMKKMEAHPKDTRVMAAVIKDSIVFRFLKSKGYKYLLFGSWFQLTRKNDHADANYNLSLLPEFSMILYRSTMLYPVTAKLGILDKRTEHWKRIMYKFDKMPEVPDMKGPNFVFGHFLIPHDPYVFNADGSFIQRHVEETRSRERKFVDQIKFANTKIKELVEKILSKSKTPPIIIIQADEGSYPARWIPGSDFTKLTNDEFKLKMGILNAFYLPHGNKSLLYPSVTPVNTFRIIFNSYFGTRLKILPDKNYIFYDEHWWNILHDPSRGAEKCEK